MTFAILLLATAQQAPLPFSNVEKITATVAADRASTCGIGPVTISYDKELQEDTLTATNAEGVTDAQLTCADKAASYYNLKLPPEPQRRFDAIRQERYAAAFLIYAKQSLAARGLLAKIPLYRPGITNDASFTRQIEQLCGPRASGAFQSRFGFHVINPDWALRNLPLRETDNDTFECLLNVTRVAGYDIGLIGNEAGDTRPSERKPGPR